MKFSCFPTRDLSWLPPTLKLPCLRVSTYYLLCEQVLLDVAKPEADLRLHIRCCYDDCSIIGHLCTGNYLLFLCAKVCPPT